MAIRKPTAPAEKSAVFAEFLAGAGMDKAAIKKIQQGEYVWLIRNENDKDQTAWSLVNANGTEGYIMSRYLYVLSEEESTAYDSTQPTQAPKYAPTPEPTAEPTPEQATMEPTDEPTVEPTAEPTATPTAEPTGDHHR